MERDQKERLKLILKNLKLLIESLESEIHSDTSSYLESKAENYDDPSYYSDNDLEFDELYDDYIDYGSSDVNNRYRITNDDDGDGL